ncbi:MAG: 3-methyl-2-oxobutanoate hydroxymethyltransferase [Acidimicrobiaceae bacterium]|nr:3-methyl-2-oxobutanoate hydroxymethyltransferase [Acidimicrobiaceae bacterium]
MTSWTLRSDSAKATAASEGRFRISYPRAPARAVRVIALDSGAEAIVRRVSLLPWNSASFYLAETSWNKTGLEGGPAEVVLHRIDGSAASLNEELTGVDSVVMVATTEAGTEAAATIGAACAVRGIITAGLVFGEDNPQTVSALRPYARVLVVSRDESDLETVLTAMRA